MYLGTIEEMHKRWQKKQTGFTIVELLIVIVVIAILAAISVVAYTGIQERSNVSRVQSDLRNIANKLSIYHVDAGSYPGNISELRASDVGSAISTTVLSDALYCGAADGYVMFMRTGPGGRQFQVGSGMALRELSPAITWGSAAPMCATTPYSFAAWNQSI